MRLERWLAVGALALYLISLWMPAVQGSGFPDQSGWDMLRQGAGAWRDGVFAWYANPALWLAVVAILLARFRLAAGIAAAGLILALSSYTAASVAAAGGRSIPPFGFALGFYIWLGAFAVVVAAAVLGWRRSRDRSRASQP